jgi:large subunit ribosomal protein L29
VKAEELRALDADELTSRLKGARRELYELRFKLAVGQLDDHRQIRKARRDIARILTVVHQRRLGIPVPAGAAAVEAEAPELMEVVDAPGQEVPPTPTLPLEEGGREPELTTEETPENVEAVAEAPAEEPAPPKRTRRRKAADEESG